MKVDARALTLGMVARLLHQQGDAAVRARYPTPSLIVCVPCVVPKTDAHPRWRTDETTHEVGDLTITGADKLRATELPTPAPPPRPDTDPAKPQPIGPASVLRPLVKSDRNPLSDLLTVGRSASNDVVIDSVEVSKLHAWIKATGAGFTISDQGSTNGTFVDGVRLEPRVDHTLRPGARVRLGTVECVHATVDELLELCAGL